MKKARVLVTNYCGRNCDGCCNKDPMFVPKEIESLSAVGCYDEILITGGDPARFPDRLHKEILNLGCYYSGKVYLYTSSVIKDRKIMRDIFRNIDGIHHTLHEDATDQDILDLKILSGIIGQYASEKLFCRLAIDKRLYDKYDFSNIDLIPWDVIRKLVWQEHCPLPPGEELLC